MCEKLQVGDFVYIEISVYMQIDQKVKVVAKMAYEADMKTSFI